MGQDMLVQKQMPQKNPKLVSRRGMGLARLGAAHEDPVHTLPFAIAFGPVLSGTIWQPCNLHLTLGVNSGCTPIDSSAGQDSAIFCEGFWRRPGRGHASPAVVANQRFGQNAQIKTWRTKGRSL